MIQRPVKQEKTSATCTKFNYVFSFFWVKLCLYLIHSGIDERHRGVTKRNNWTGPDEIMFLFFYKVIQKVLPDRFGWNVSVNVFTNSASDIEIFNAGLRTEQPGARIWGHYLTKIWSFSEFCRGSWWIWKTI